VLVLMGNDCNGIDDLMNSSAAIVRAFYPATHGAKALASLLFGKANRWGESLKQSCQPVRRGAAWRGGSASSNTTVASIRQTGRPDRLD
jgi:hypothetical protein